MVSKIILNSISTSLNRSFGELSSITLDSRLVEDKSMFFAVKGQKTDGRLYAIDSLNKGAYVICDRIDIPAILNDYASDYANSLGHKNLIFVDDILKTIEHIITNILADLRSNGAKVIGVTGSSGKTTIKHALSKVISENLGTVFSTEQSYNTEYGLLLSLAKIKNNVDYIILELGISKPGDMDIMGRITSPDLVLISNVGLAHTGYFNAGYFSTGYDTGYFGGKEVSPRNALIQEKLKILQYMSKSKQSLAVVNSDLREEVTKNYPEHNVVFFNDLCEEIDQNSLKAKGKIVTHPKLCDMNPKLCDMKSYDAKSYDIAFQNLYGGHHIENACAIVALLQDKIDPKMIIKSLESTESISGRGVIFENLKIPSSDIQFTLFDSSYNANPGLNGSMYKELEVLRKFKKNGRKVAVVLGEMRELGKDTPHLNQEILDQAKDFSNQIILVGWKNDYKNDFLGAENIHVLEDNVNENNVTTIFDMIVKILENDMVLFIKGSNSTGLYKYLVPMILRICNV